MIDWQAIGVISTVAVGVGGGAVLFIWRLGGLERARQGHDRDIAQLHTDSDNNGKKLDASMQIFREECLSHRQYQQTRDDEIIGALRERMQEGEGQFGRLEAGMDDVKARLVRIETAVNGKSS